MPSAQRMAFESRMKQDKELSDLVGELKTIFSGLETLALKSEMEHYHQELMARQLSGKPGVNLWVKYSIAAVIAILMVSVIWLWFIPESEESSLFARFYEPDPGLITAMSNETNYAFDRGMVDYKSGLYDAAITRWEELLIQKPENDTLQYFLGAAYLAVKDFESAKSYLNQVAEKSEGRFLQDANWYLALIHLAEGNPEITKRFLEKAEHPSKNALLEALDAK